MYFPPDFDLARSIELARLIMQAYEQLESFQQGIPWTPREGYTLIKELSPEPIAGATRIVHTQFEPERKLLRKRRPLSDTSFPIGFVARKDNTVSIVFRGTVTITEWVRNLNVRLSDYLRAGYGSVHEGFLETYESIRRELLDVLRSLDSRHRLFLCGHSLGAALATLALPDIATHMKTGSPTVYTFGSPRVGDDGFCRSFNERFAGRSYRIVNTSDMIVSLPLPVPIFGIIGGYFSHVETPIDFTTQEGALEKNHVIETYLSALLSARQSKRALLGRLFKARLPGR